MAEALTERSDQGGVGRGGTAAKAKGETVVGIEGTPLPRGRGGPRAVHLMWRGRPLCGVIRDATVPPPGGL